MKVLIPILTLVFLLGLVVPGIAEAQGIPSLGSGFHIIPDASELDPACPEGAPLSFGAVMQVAQNMLGIAIAFGVLIFVIMMAWAGFLLITSPVNPEAKSTARKMLGNAAIGLLITLSAWLIVDFVMKTLYNPSDASWGPWNSILGDGPVCVIKSDVANLFTGKITGGSIGFIPAESGDSTPGGTAPPSGNIQERICQATNSYKGTSTAAGPDGGNKACAWAVNNILKNARVSTIGTSNVAQMESLLKQGRGTLIAQSSAVCGDIVIEAGKSHVGVCMNAGCTQVLSNSSSKASFTWPSDISFKPSYKSGNGRIYRVTN